MNEAKLNEALDLAGTLGAADAEVVFLRESDFTVALRNDEIDTLSSAESIGFGVRVFTADRRMGFAFSSDLSAGPKPVVDAAWENAQANDPDPHGVLPETSARSGDDWSEEDFSAIPAADKVAFARELSKITKARDPRIVQVLRSAFANGQFEFVIANSRGLIRSFRNASCNCYAMAVAAQEGGDSESGMEFDFARTFGGLRMDWVSERCADKALRKLGGKPCATKSMPIVLDNYIMTQFLQVIGPSLMANNVLKGKSMFAGRMGESIASDKVSIVDQNDLRTAINPSPFDGEGVSAQRKDVLDAGVLKTYLHNSYTAHRMEASTTANAGRGGFSSTPDVSATNFFLAPGTAAPAALFEQAGEGLFVTGAMGVHTADPISGDFSFGAEGLLIEGGKPGRPVRGVTIAGNIGKLLKNIAVVGDDLRFFGSYGGPSVLISEMMVSGE